jgi:hypothetical protein
VELRDPQIPYRALEEIENEHQRHCGMHCIRGSFSFWGVGVGFPTFQDYAVVIFLPQWLGLTSKHVLL